MNQVSITVITETADGKYGHINRVEYVADSNKRGELDLDTPDCPSSKDFENKISSMLKEITGIANRDSLTIVSHTLVIF
jgi:hypothetical protein